MPNPIPPVTPLVGVSETGGEVQLESSGGSRASVASPAVVLPLGPAPSTAAQPQTARRGGLDTPQGSGVRASGQPGEPRPFSVFPPARAGFDPQRAFTALWPQVERVAGPAERPGLEDALRRYVTAYANFTRDNPGEVLGPYSLMVNFGARGDTAGRGFIFDLHNQRIMRGPMLVSHGHGHRQVPHTLTERSFGETYGGAGSPFSNERDSERSSLGVYTTFPLAGLHKGEYARVGLDGRSVGFNDRARARGVYMHGVPNVGYRTQGCPGFQMIERVSADGVSESDNAAIQRLLEREPSFIFLDAPVPSWYQRDRWLRRG